MYDTLDGFPSDLKLERIVSVDITDAMPWRTRVALRLPIPRARAARAQLTSTPKARKVLTWQKLVDSRRLGRRHPRPALDDTALLQYTSGTTGTPKGAILTHRNLRANAMQGRAWVPGLHEGDEIFYGVLPLFHAYGMTLCLTFAMSIGARLVLFPKYDATLVADAAKKSPPTFLPAVPPIYDQLARSAANGEIDLTSVRFAISGAMSLPVETVASWEKATGGLLVEGYGMTETSPVALGNPIGPSRRPGTVGVPFPEHRHPGGRPGRPARGPSVRRVGGAALRGPQVFQGYWQRPYETAETLLAGGWVRTGDIVTVSADGFVTVVDRMKEIIITGGFNVAPTEVEEALHGHPDVVEAPWWRCLARAARRWSRPSCCARAPSSMPDALRDYCREHLAAYKVPRRFFAVEELPRSLIGKVLRGRCGSSCCATRRSSGGRRCGDGLLRGCGVRDSVCRAPVARCDADSSMLGAGGCSYGLNPERGMVGTSELGRARRCRPPRSQRLEARRPSQQVGVGVRRAGEGQAHRHPDVGHRAHRHRHGRDAEVPDRQVAVGDPHAVAPCGGRGRFVHVGVGRTHVGDRGEDHGVEAARGHPLLEVDPPGALQALEARADELGERAPRADR